jgi:hypothetical protein
VIFEDAVLKDRVTFRPSSKQRLAKTKTQKFEWQNREMKIFIENQQIS